MGLVPCPGRSTKRRTHIPLPDQVLFIDAVNSTVCRPPAAGYLSFQIVPQSVPLKESQTGKVVRSIFHSDQLGVPSITYCFHSDLQYHQESRRELVAAGTRPIYQYHSSFITIYQERWRLRRKRPSSLHTLSYNLIDHTLHTLLSSSLTMWAEYLGTHSLYTSGDFVQP